MDTRITTALTLEAPLARHDLYIAPHKALRMFMSDTQLRIGALDVDDPVAAQAGLAQLRELLELAHHHQEIEDTFVLTALEARRPGASAANAREHRKHAETIANLEALVDSTERAVTDAAPERAWLAHRLYLAFSRFIADNLEHMAIEETHINPILWALFSDAELRAIETDIVGWLTPAQKASSVRWMIPSLSPGERVAWVAGVRPMMPSTAFDQLFSYVCTLLPQGDADKLRAAIS